MVASTPEGTRGRVGKFHAAVAARFSGRAAAIKSLQISSLRKQPLFLRFKTAPVYPLRPNLADPATPEMLLQATFETPGKSPRAAALGKVASSDITPQRLPVDKRQHGEHPT